MVMMGSYADWHLGSEQYQWLERDLAAFNRSHTPWLVAAFHTPWWASDATCMKLGQHIVHSVLC